MIPVYTHYYYHKAGLKIANHYSDIQYYITLLLRLLIPFPYLFFPPQARILVAQTLMEQDNLEGQLGPYIPLVYRQCPEITTTPVSVTSH